MKSNTRLLRCPLGRPKAAYTLCTLNTSWHSAMKAKAHSSLAMLQECLCNSWGDPSATPSYEHRKEVRYTFYFQIEKNNTLQLKQQAWSHFSKSYAKLCGQHLRRELKNLHLNLKQLFSRPRCSAVMPIVTTHGDKQLILCNLLKSEKFEGKVKANQMPREVTLQMHKYEQILYG